MANTTIALRSSGTAAATPSLGVLANGELSINYADGIIYYKTVSNTLGSIRTTQPAGLTTEIQFNDAGSFGSNAALTFNKTTAQLNVTNLLVSTNLTTGTGVGGTIAGANNIYANNFIANTGGITTAGNSSLNGIVTVNYNVGAASSQNAAIEMYGANTKGGTGYFDFISANNRSAGTTNPSKWFRIDSNGKFQIINSAYTLNIFDLNDSGYLTIPGGLATSQYIQFSDGSRQYTANAGGGSLSNNQILAGLQTVSNTANITFDTMILANNNNGRNLRIGDDAWIGDVNLSDTIAIRGAFNTANAYIVFGSADTTALGRAGSGALTYGGNTVWHAGNDGASSGLDADTLDGLHASSFANATFANTDYTTISATAAVYGNSAYVPVTTLTANGRVSSITNTAIALDAAAITTGTLAVARGGTGVTTSTGTGAVTLNTAPTITLPTINNIRQGYSTTATAAGTTTLTVNSNYYQFFTGTTTQTLALPAPQTMTLGMAFLVVNNSTGSISVIASNSAAVATVLAGQAVLFVSIDLTAGNGAAGWSVEVVTHSSATTSVQGVVQLTDSTSSTSTNTAATPNSVKTAYDLAATKFNSSGGAISGDVSVTGNLTITGNLTSFSANNIVIDDSIIYIANNNSANVTDIGIVGHFTDSKYQHTGFVRDASDGRWKLFSNVTSEPTTTVDFTTAVYDTLQIGRLETTTANVATTIYTGNVNVTTTVDWPAAGYAPPSLTTRSSGTKLTLYPSLSTTSVDYAIGINGGVLWSSIPAANTSYSFKWYGGESEIASLSGDGKLTAISANITSTTVSTSNTTGALTVLGGIGAKGNVSVDGVIFPDGTRQTTAASGGASIGDVLALSIALG